MKRTVRAALWLAATVMLAAIGFAAGQDDSAAKAEKIVNTTCLSCHDMRPIQTKALDADGWKKIVDSMIDKGATVSKGDIPMLVSFLEDNYGPLPEGNGKDILLEKCTVCHDLKRVKQHLASPEEWADTLNSMENEGLQLSQEEFGIILRYLARNFRP
jgi:hypothetical protein